VAEAPEDTAREQLELLVGDDRRRLTDWQEVEITRTLGAASGTIKLSVGPTARVPYALKPGDSYEIRLAGELVATGWIDSLRAIDDPSGWTLSVTGRDRTADLVDCSAPDSASELLNVRLDEVVRTIAKPFGVRARFEVSAPEPFDVYRIDPGETAWSAIDRAARMRGAIPHTDPDGTLVLGRPSGFTLDGVSLEAGRNILRSELAWDHGGRHRVYRVRGQRAGSDDGWGEVVALIEGRAEDTEIRAGRELLIIAEGAVSPATAAVRAQWEAAYRAAAASRVVVRVAGWTTSQSLAAGLWPINRRVDVRIPRLMIDGVLLIEEVRFKRSPRAGTTCELALVRPDAYIPAPAVPAALNPFAGLEDGELDEEDFEFE
jgi:prophage tail gpP-like protein